MITITVTDDSIGQEMKMTITEAEGQDKYSCEVQFNPPVNSDRPNDLWGAVQQAVVEGVIGLGEQS
jgi:hypothetical protein